MVRYAAFTKVKFKLKSGRILNGTTAILNIRSVGGANVYASLCRRTKILDMVGVVSVDV